MKSTVYILLGITFLFILFPQCSAVNVMSTVPHNEIVIDGQLDEWYHQPLALNNEDLRLTVANDRQSLYLCFELKDRRLIRQAIMNGLTVWIDPKGRRREIYGIRYPLPQRGPDLMQFRANRSRFEQQQKPFHALLENQREMEIIRPKEKYRYLLPLFGEQEITLKTAVRHQNLVYEFRLPLNADPDDKMLVPLKPGQQIGLGIKIDAPDFGNRSRPQRGFSGPDQRPPGGMGQNPRGFGPGGMPGDRAGQMMSEYKTWITVKLSAAD